MSSYISSYVILGHLQGARGYLLEGVRIIL